MSTRGARQPCTLTKPAMSAVPANSEGRSSFRDDPGAPRAERRQPAIPPINGEAISSRTAIRIDTATQIDMDSPSGVSGVASVTTIRTMKAATNAAIA